MPTNPFPTLKTWQQEKKKYGIPGKVIKSGAFGEKLDKLAKAFDAKGGKSVDANNFAGVLQVLQQGHVLVDEWLLKAKPMKAGAFTDKKGAIDCVEGYKGRLDGTVSRVHQIVDPLHESRGGIKKALDMYRAAVADPSDPDKLMTLWDVGARQYVGQGFRLAVKNAAALGYSAAVVKQLKAYDALIAKWMDTMLNGVDAEKTAADPKARERFLTDMHKAFSIASNVLKQVPHN
jgi:hypothetical protein